MSSRTLSLLVGLLSLLWFWFCWHWHCCWIRGVCCQNVAAAVAPTDDKADMIGDRGPLVFKWSNPEAFTNDKYEAYKSSFLKDNSGDNILIITGQYYKDEPNPTSYENLGLARAAAVRDLLKGDIPPERIRLASQLMGEFSGDKSAYFPSVRFGWAEAEVEKSEVVELADRAIILFPYNSVQKDADPAIDNYLNDLAKRLQTTNETVTLTGHTDSDGTETYNFNLGQQRAQVIRDILIRKGVKRAQIKVLSKGETQPVASNETEAGKHQNRRVEVELQKN